MELRIEHLSKTYPNGVRALDDVSLTIPLGMFGLLGPNGAGKSTLMRTIATLQEPDSGQVWLGGIDALRQKAEVRKILGYLPQDFGVYPRISAQDMLDHLALLKGFVNRRERKELVEALLVRVNLHQVRKKALAGFSGGMRQRFGIAQALIGNPRLLLLDEPAAGVPEDERHEILAAVAALPSDVTVLLIEHDMDIVFSFADRISVLVNGALFVEGSPDEVARDPRVKAVYLGEELADA